MNDVLNNIIDQGEEIEISFDSLKPYKYNVKKHVSDIKKLKKSIESFGYNSRILINHKNYICAGHGRYYAIKELIEEGHTELEKIRVIKLSISNKQFIAYNFVDNKLSDVSVWDKKNLKHALLKLKDTEYDFKDFGFSDKELSKYFSDIDTEDNFQNINFKANKNPKIIIYVKNKEELDEIREKIFDFLENYEVEIK
jgi:hypothetical protein